MMDAFNDLIARLEAATSPSRELDRLIHNARGDRIAISAEELVEDDRLDAFFMRYTDSLDAAMTLVPEGMSVDVHIGPRGLGNDATVYQPVKSIDDQGRRVTTFVPHEAKAVRESVMYWTPASVQVCIAALRARASLPPRAAGQIGTLSSCVAAQPPEPSLDEWRERYHAVLAERDESRAEVAQLEQELTIVRALRKQDELARLRSPTVTGEDLPYPGDAPEGEPRECDGVAWDRIPPVETATKEQLHGKFYAAFHAWFMSEDNGCDFWSECDAPEALATVAVELADRESAVARAQGVREGIEKAARSVEDGPGMFRSEHIARAIRALATLALEKDNDG